MTEKQMLKYKNKNVKIRYRKFRFAVEILEVEGLVIPEERVIYVNRNNSLRPYKHYDFAILNNEICNYIYYNQVKDIVEIKEI